ncbi:MAG: hypothetical protein ACK521_12615 [bacterium]
MKEFTSNPDEKRRVRSRMMHLLEKTNERITLDRQFLISEKMDVIIKEVQPMPLLKIK